MLYRARPVTVNLTRIYTRLGDGGETHLGDMSRVPKTHERIEAYGTVDELNAQLGVALAMADVPERIAGWLARIQNDLFDVGADICVPHGGDRERLRLSAEQTAWLEGACDEVNAELPNLKSFVLPGGTPLAAQLHVCRTVCRRAERRTIACGDERQRRVRALPEPAVGPAVHPVPRRQRRRRRERAAVAAGPLPAVSDAGLYPAEHRALRELSAFTRQLVGHWARLGGRLGGDAAELLERGAATARELIGELTEPLLGARHRALPGLAGRRRQRGRAARRERPDARAQPGAAQRRARHPARDDAARLPRPSWPTAAATPPSRPGTARGRRGCASIEEDARAVAVAEGREPDRAIEPAGPGSSGRAGHAVANGLGTLGEALDGSAVGRAARKLRGR